MLTGRRVVMAVAFVAAGLVEMATAVERALLILKTD